LFESLAAGVPVVVSDLPGMRPIVLDDPAGVLGAVCDPSDPASIGAAIRSILEQSRADGGELRRRCLGAAHARWNWEHESLPLVALYEELGARIAAAAGSSPDGPQARRS
jgi:glycosyltransferase involved in cell wall biosynthesis